MSYKILAINPGSTSTKLALYENEARIFERSLPHTAKELEPFEEILDQFEFRKKLILEALREANVDLQELSAVVGRGGMMPNMKAGGYVANEAMVNTLREGLASPHASNLGALLARDIAAPMGIPAYIYDAVTSDEMEQVARFTGMPEVSRKSFCHVLNMRAVSRKVAVKYAKRYEDMNILVAHLGGGISLSVHHKGKIVDCIRDDEAPFSPERAGTIPALELVDLCYSGQYTRQEMIRKFRGKGGLKAYLGTQDLREVLDMSQNGDKLAADLLEAEVYQIAKAVGQLAPVLSGKYDCIILTGGMVYSEELVEKIRERICFIAPVEVVPGEFEMEALALGALRMIDGQEQAREYVHP
ncbi:butyrate kinase [Aminipila butyrica]|uniref:Probable butyrate kinase n=1 Tax=Aminipila butyrica TaxID=433296 RepID=A0A858BSJ2_9FIRM|nr:butyrate kinase [Aminipila butyrica]QIB68941.1 butyrate kinase [Aminipila butyrica]